MKNLLGPLADLIALTIALSSALSLRSAHDGAGSVIMAVFAVAFVLSLVSHAAALNGDEVLVRWSNWLCLILGVGSFIAGLLYVFGSAFLAVSL